MRHEGEVVLIYYQDQPAIFARIESIEPDIKRGWYHVTLLLLSIPSQVVTWILRDSYIDGAPFTMDGTTMRLQEVKRVTARREPEDQVQSGKKESASRPGKVIPLKKP